MRRLLDGSDQGSIGSIDDNVLCVRNKGVFIRVRYYGPFEDGLVHAAEAVTTGSGDITHYNAVCRIIWYPAGVVEHEEGPITCLWCLVRSTK